MRAALVLLGCSLIALGCANTPHKPAHRDPPLPRQMCELTDWSLYARRELGSISCPPHIPRFVVRVSRQDFF